MRVHVAHYGFLALAAVTIAGCSSDRATAPNARPIRPQGPAADLVDLTSTPARYIQVATSQDFDGFGGTAETTYLADDFVVPVGAVWTVTEVAITGALHFNHLPFSIRTDVDGHPGAIVPNANVSLDISAGDDSPLGGHDFLFTLPTAVTLSAGKYWLVIESGTPEDGTSLWQLSDPANSAGLVSFDNGATWGSLGHDYAFGVFGTVKLTQTITIAPVTPNPATPGATATVNASASSSLTVALAAGPSDVCTLAGTTLSFVGIGTCTVTANQAGNTTYLPATEVTQDVRVGKLAQTITFPDIKPNPATVSSTATLGATASSGLTVGYSSLTPNVCTVNGGMVSYTGVGTCTVTANQAGNAAYDAAAPVSQSVKVDYRFDGFLDPVKNGNVVNAVQAGQIVPLKWRLTDANGAPITTLAMPRIAVADLSCTLGSTTDRLAEQPGGSSGLQNLGDGYYQYNWKSPASYAKSCKTLQLDLGEGTGARTARFAFTK